MSIEWGRALPVIVSILIIIAVAVLRQYSRTFAAIAATMPINIPLALWIIYDRSDRAGNAEFFETLLIGLPATMLFILAAWLAARAGWGLLPVILVGYAAWGVALLLGLWLKTLFVH